METLKYGSRGEDVRTLQDFLGIGADGVFGALTEAAVKKHQTSKGLEADGIVGPLTWAAMTGTSVKTLKVVDYKQYDSRWGNVVFTSCGNKAQTIKNSGCGPTAMANIIATFFDPSITPKDVARLVVNNGYRTKSNGTDWDFFEWVATRYEFSGYDEMPGTYLGGKTANHESAIRALAEGALIVASMAPNFWTRNGHFITLTKCQGGYMYANDPASAVRKRQKLSAFKKQVKKYFIFYPPIGWNDEAADEPVEVVTDAPETAAGTPELPGYVPGNGVYDVSKWQGKIDWDKAAKSGKIALMILRAGFGQETVDERFERNATFCRKYGIPFAVYWYSYAYSVDRIQNEMTSFYKVASPHKPLWYCLDAEESTLNGLMIDAGTKKLRELGVKKIVNYIANHRFKAYGCDTSLPDAIWIPKYTKLNPPTHRPCDLWQYGGEKVPGFGNDAIDANRVPASGRFGLKWFLGDDSAVKNVINNDD